MTYVSFFPRVSFYSYKYSKLVFQMTVRMATCQELAADKQTIADLRRHYFDIAQSSTPVSVLLPWFPSLARKTKTKSTRELYLLIKKYVTMRREAKIPSSDPIDLLIAQGDSDDDIIGVSSINLFHHCGARFKILIYRLSWASFLLGLSTPGLLVSVCYRSFINLLTLKFIKACWVLLKLGSNPKWKDRVMKEYTTLVANHSNTLSTEPLYKRLASIPLNAWEDELPSVDLVIRETLRFTVSGALLRRNVQKDIVVDGVTIKRDDFMVLPTYGPHMDPNIYSNPSSFDPDRYLEGREEDKKEAFAYVGWGAGASDFDFIEIRK